MLREEVEGGREERKNERGKGGGCEVSRGCGRRKVCEGLGEDLWEGREGSGPYSGLVASASVQPHRKNDVY